MAQAAAISPETLRKIETGRLATAAFTTIAALARVLPLSLDELADICLWAHGPSARHCQLPWAAGRAPVIGSGCDTTGQGADVFH